MTLLDSLENNTDNTSGPEGPDGAGEVDTRTPPEPED
jgi:hypothetical protein